MLKRTALAIFAPLVLAACDPEVRAVEQDFVVEETVTQSTTPYFQQQAQVTQSQQFQNPYGVAGQQFTSTLSQPGRILLSNGQYGTVGQTYQTGQYGTQIASTAITRFTSGGSQSGLRADVGDRVFFTTDSSVLDARGAAVIDQLAAWMKQYPSSKIRLEGHADERGTRDYNIALGDSRATTIRNRLLQLGISADRLTTVSYGKERPVASGSTPTVWAQNRRAVFVVL